MDLFSLAAIITLNSSGFLNGLKDASASMQTFGDRVGAVASAAGKAVTAGLAVASGAAVAFGTDAVNVGKQFDAAMANVASISGATGDALNDLRETAIAMGGSTKFSATEAADALGYMAMAGWSTGEMLDGISGIMNLAAASGESLARTSDIVTDALTAFGLSASDSGHFADVLAVASSAANTNVSLMGETFKYVAPIIGTLYGQGELAAEGMEDAAVAIGLMANAGIKASQAGTALRSGLTRLTKPTDDMIATMKQLGLAVSEISAEEAEQQTKALDESLKAKKKAYSDDEEALQESQERQYESLKKALERRYDAQKEAYDAEYSETKKALDKSYEAAKNTYERQYAERKKALDAEYDTAKETYDAEYEALKKSLDAEYEAQEETFSSEYDARKNALDASYDALEKALDADIAATEKAQSKTLAGVQRAQEEQVKAYQDATEAKLALIDEEYRESLKNIDRDEYERLKAIDDQIAAIQAQSDAAAKAAEDEERRQRRAELQKAVDTAKTAEARQEAERKLAEYNENIRRKDAEAARKAQIAQLKADKDAVKEGIKADKEAAKEQRDAQAKAAKEARADGLDELKERQKDELTALKNAQKDELDAQKAARKEQLNAAREANADELKELKKAQSAQLDAAKEANSAQLAELKRAQSKQLTAIKEANAQDLKELKALNDWRLSSIEEANEAQLKGLSKAQAAQLEQLRESNSDRLAEVKKANAKELKALQESNRDKLAEYQEYVTEQKKAIKAAAESAQSIVLTDENGNMRELLNSDKEHLGVINLLRDAFANLSEVEKMEAMSTLVGQEASAGWLAILNADSDTIADLEGRVKSASDVIDGYNGMAEKMAAVHEDSLAGSLTTLGSAIETLKIRISDKLTPTLRTFAKFGQQSVVALTEAFEEGDFSGMMDALGPIIEQGIGMLMSYIPNVVEVGGKLLGAVVTGIVNNLPVLADGAVKLATAFGGYLLDAFRETFDNWGLGDNFDAVVTAFSETFAKVRDAVSGAFERIRAVFADAFGDYFTSGQAAQDVTNLLITGIELLGDAVSVAADIVATAVEKIRDFVAWLSAGSDGADIFIAVVSGIATAFAAFEAVTTVIAILKKVQTAFSTLFAVMAANPIAVVIALIAGLVTGIVILWKKNEDFRNAVKEIWAAITGFFSDAWEAIKKAWEPAADYFGRIWEDIETIFSVAAPVFEAIFSAAWENVKRIWSVAVFFFEIVWDGIKMVFSVAGDVIGGFFSVAWDAVVLVWDAAFGYFENLWHSIAGIFEGVKLFFGGHFEEAFEAVKEGFSGWGKFFQGLLDDVIDIFSDIGTTFFNIGADIVNGLIEGVGDLWDGFLTLVGLKTDEVKEEFTGPEGFDEHSPSKWSEDVFRRILEGGEIGFDKGLPSILSNAESAVRDIQDALSADPFSVSGGYNLSGAYNYARPPQLAAATAGGAPNYGQSFRPAPVNITMVNDVGGDKYERLQYQYRAAEDARRGPSLVNL